MTPMGRDLRCVGAWLLALGASLGTQEAGAAPLQDAQSGTAPWLSEIDARLELPIPGEPSGVAFEDLDGDGAEELLATSRGATGQSGWLLVWASLSAAPERIPLPNYPIGPEPAAEGRVWIASQASDELLLVAPLAGTGAAIEMRAQLPGRPRALAGGNLPGRGPIAAVATAQGQLVLCSLEGELDVHSTGLQAPTFVYLAGDQIFVGCQGTGAVHHFLWQDGALAENEPIELDAIPRAMWGGELGGESVALIAGGDRSVWQRTDDGWKAGKPVGAIPLRLVQGSPGEVFGLSFYDLTWRRLGAGLSVLESGYAGQDPWDLASGDWDGDGLPDLAIANRGAHRISVLRGKPGGSLRNALSLPSGGGPHSLASGDIDGDGDVDLVSIDALDDSLSFHLAQPDGSFVRSPYRPRTQRAGDRALLTDIDGDGDLDLVHRAELGGQAGVRIWLGRASEEPGLLPEQSFEVPTGGGIGDLVVLPAPRDLRDPGEPDRAGLPELLAADPVGAALYRLGWDPESQRPQVTATYPLGGSPRALAVEGSGAGALLWVCLGGTGGRQGIALLALPSTAATGEEGLPVERSFVATPHEPMDLVLARGSQGLEPVVLARPAGQDGPGRLLRLIPTDGGGWRCGPGMVTGTRPFAVAAGDLDGDGLDEVLVGAQNSHHVNLWTRTAAGALVRLPDLGAGRGVLDVLVVDLSQGRPAVVAANAFSSDLSVMR